VGITGRCVRGCEGAFQRSRARRQVVSAQRLERDGRLSCARFARRHRRLSLGRIKSPHLRHPPSLSVATDAAAAPVCFRSLLAVDLDYMRVALMC